jgi:hypothetical protein
MGGACSTNGEKRNAYRILVDRKERADWEDLDVRGRIIEKWILWDLAQDRDEWKALVKMAMNLRVS